MLEKITLAENDWGKAYIMLNKPVNGNVEAGIYACDAGKSLNLHAHEDGDELCYILEGDAIFEMEGAKTKVCKGEMIRLAKGKMHLSYGADGQAFVSAYIVYPEA